MGGGDDCDRPACDDTKSALTAALQRVGASTKDASTRVSKKSTKEDNVPSDYNACPPTRDEIGVSTWSLLHSMVRDSTLPCFILYTLAHSVWICPTVQL